MDKHNFTVIPYLWQISEHSSLPLVSIIIVGSDIQFVSVEHEITKTAKIFKNCLLLIGWPWDTLTQIPKQIS